ncbi:DUF1642 domain-containing protein [Enterococcus faecalis]|uniref:DUF1642 domain-containing protein n=1 Tax=Enterococcus faecalis TaxID=1351 RepID=UPI00032D8677|nr:DUF1642 domain-containing protein [Enterococcus faecalis]EGO2593031.1 DUF1642 domain-containing protein [Enterococcus faecalis]EKR9397661.1 DUF1642 domain-containing protein [Enterococcus faecalis]EOM23327.1 hypothetical protein U9C_02445 [Enterococcus faecalis EnGen0253]EOM30316.1 hypothetical protein U9G_02652 [Enterococcus faecalis EnGen0232]HDV0875069.1 DUF1642 domain-containing protein [Enterococcus faecalis]
MNKQELIEELECLEVPTDSLDYLKGANYAVEKAISLAKQLDEPKKVVVPKFVADFIEDGNHYDKIAFLVHQKYLGINSLMRECPVKDWLMSVDYETVLSLVNGYEVEKEQLYKVVIDHKYLVQLFSGRTDARLVEYEELTNWHDSAYKLTESVIKAIDERYWPFAVKVEGE